MRIVLASNNRHKLAELQALLAPLGHQLLTQGELGVGEAEEPHATFLENALAKARHASAATGLPSLADDSGLCVAALGGAPGVQSARYAQQAGAGQGDAANNALLLERMRGQGERAAHFYCALVALRSAADPEPLVAEGRLHGTLLQAPLGEGGFGYDPLLWLADAQCSVAQLSAQHKNRMSHRALAAQQLAQSLRVLWPQG